jgi:uncharacterized membrane protein
MATGERRGGHVGATRTLLIAVIGGLVALVGVFASMPAATQASADKSFRIDALEATAEIRADGTMFVTERITYDYDGGPFEFGIRSFERNEDQITDFAAADGDGPLEVIAPDDSISGDWEWKLRSPTSDRTVSYTITYSARDVLTLGRDVTDLEWTAVGADHPGIGRARLMVTFPKSVVPAAEGVDDTDASVLRGFAHGPRNGQVEVLTSAVVATWTNVPARQFLEVRAVVPAATFAMVGEENQLADILAEERRRQNAVAQEDDDRRTGWFLSAALTALAAFGTGVLWLVGGREMKSKEVLGEYWREPLDDPPAVVIANLGRGSVNEGRAVAATIVDLAQRGYLRIVGERQERFGPDKVVHRYFWLGKPFAPDVLRYEKDLLEMVFRGATETTSEELAEWAREHQATAKKMLDSVTAGMRAEYDARGYDEVTRGRLVGLLVAICGGVAIASLLASWSTGHGLGWWGVALAAGLFGIGVKLLSNRNRASVEAAAKAEGLEQFLKDFSRLEDAPVGHLILWERYLVYAVALGVSADLVRGMALRVPQVIADPSFGAWYVPVGVLGRFDGFDQIETTGSSIVAASTPNSSGSGGGASFGGGGGFGGGGFGAR